MKEFPHKVGERMFLAGGGYIESEIDDPLKLSDFYGRTALHESRHANAAPEKVVEASIKPDGNSKGHVLFTEHDDIAAAAALAFDMPGTGFDEWTIQGNVDIAASGARAVLDGQQENVIIFARFLEANRNADRADLYEVRDRTKNGNKINIRIVTTSGIRSYEARAGIDEGKVMIPGEWIDLAKAA